MGRRLILLAISIAAVLMAVVPVQANEEMNVIDKCWRVDPHWKNHRQRLATCSVGFAGKMIGNIGPDVVKYRVTDPSDDPLNPKPGTLRYATTHVKGKVWITFQRDMQITLAKALLINSFTTIDARGVNVHIADGGCLVLNEVNNVIIHGLKISGCKPQEAGQIMGPNGKVMHLGPTDADGIRIMSCSKIWVDHNTLQECEDGLIDVTKGSTDITISNNRFQFQDKVMLLGHDDAYSLDKNMKVTVAFNHFGPNCNQRMPRVRFGFAHVVNNLYQGWGIYAIGGTMNPSVESQANLFIAADGGKKEIIWNSGKTGNYKSVNDIFENGASFTQTMSNGNALAPHYTPEQQFQVADGNAVRALTKYAGAFNSTRTSRP